MGAYLMWMPVTSMLIGCGCLLGVGAYLVWVLSGCGCGLLGVGAYLVWIWISRCGCLHY